MKILSCICLFALASGIGPASAELSRRGQVELGFGIKAALPSGDFDEVADLGFGGSGQVGYWLTDRLTIGGNYDYTGFLPPDFLGNIEAYALYDDIGWSVDELGAYVQYDVRQTVKRTGRFERTNSVYLGARVGRFKSTFTAEAGGLESEFSDTRTGYVGCVGLRFWGEAWEQPSIFRGLSAWVEVDYASIPYGDETIRYLALEAGLGGHFGSKP